MAAGEDQSQPVIFNTSVYCVVRCSFEGISDLFLRGIEPCAPAQCINGFESSRGNQPGAGIGWHSFLWPVLQRCRKSIMHRILSQIEIAEQADERGENATGFRPVKRIQILLHLFDGSLS